MSTFATDQDDDVDHAEVLVAQPVLFGLADLPSSERSASVELGTSAVTPNEAGETPKVPATPLATPGIVWIRRDDIVATSTVALALVAVLFFLQWSRALLIPVAISIIIAFAMNPVVLRLRRAGIPRPIGAGLLVAAVWGGLTWSSYLLQDDITNLATQAPVVVERLSYGFEAWKESKLSIWGGVSDAMTTIEKMANEGAASANATRLGSARAAVQAAATPAPILRWRDFLWTGSAGLAAFAADAVVVSFLVYFLLSSGEALKRQFLRNSMNSLSQRKRKIQLLSEISSQIQYSLLVLVVTNVALGVLTGLVFAGLGMHQPALWGVIASIAHFVPYLGTVLIVVGSFVFAYLQTGDWGNATLVAFSALVVATIIGMLLTTWLQARASRIDAAVVFASLVLWGWLWGVWGLLLSAPMLAMVKVICQHIVPLRPLAAVMSTSKRRPRYKYSKKSRTTDAKGGTHAETLVERRVVSATPTDH